MRLTIRKLSNCLIIHARIAYGGIATARCPSVRPSVRLTCSEEVRVDAVRQTSRQLTNHSASHLLCCHLSELEQTLIAVTRCTRRQQHIATFSQRTCAYTQPHSRGKRLKGVYLAPGLPFHWNIFHLRLANSLTLVIMFFPFFIQLFFPFSMEGEPTAQYRSESVKAAETNWTVTRNQCSACTPLEYSYKTFSQNDYRLYGLKNCTYQERLN